MTVLSKIHPVSLREQVVEAIRTAIIEGRLRPNDRISEPGLTELLGVSRTPIREALILLEREGLIVSQPNRGYFVCAFNAEDVENVFSMRTVLENFAAERVIQQLTPGDLEHLAHLIEVQQQCIEAGDFKQLRRADMAFHQFLIEASCHPLLIRSWQEIVAQVAALLYLRAEDMPDYDEYLAIQDHLAILRAYQARDLERVKAENRRINERVAGECKRAVRSLQRLAAGDRPAQSSSVHE